MNYGWYEILDRIHVIQSQLEDYVGNHQEADEELKALVDEAQDKLNKVYQYAGKMLRNSEGGLK